MGCFRWGVRGVVLLFAVVVTASLVSAQVSVLTQHNDNSRTGQNLQETVLTTSNVNVSTFGKLFSLPVDSNIYTQPLYVSNLSIGGTTHNVVYVGTANNTVYAFDADSGDTTPLWAVNLGTPVPAPDICVTQPSACPYTDVVPVIGILATPVIDASSGTIYVVAKTKDGSGNYHFKLHALDLSSGQEKFGGPTEITATGLTPLTQLNRPGLLLANSMVYLAFGSVGDFPTWHGWVMAYDAATLQQVGIYNSTPQNNAEGGAGIWQTGNGLVADSNGDIYAISSNGNFDVNTGGKDYGSAYLRLSGTPQSGNTLSVLDYFVPYNQASLNPESDNVDLGSGGAMLIPNTTLLVGGGKDSVLRVVDTTNMGKYNGSFDTNHQNIQNATPVQIFGSPVYWDTPNLGPMVYLWGSGDFAKGWGYNASTTKLSTSPVMESKIQGVTNTFYDHAPLSISANGSGSTAQPGTGILWAAMPYSGDANGTTGAPVPGALYALDATDLTKELWDSQMNSARDSVGNYAKFVPPTVVNGKIYLATFSNSGTAVEPASLVVYGLITPPGFTLTAGPQSQSIQAGNSASYIVYAASQGGYTGSVSFSCPNLTNGLSCSFTPPSVTLTQGGSQVSSQLAITTASSTASGTYPVTIKGVSGTLTQTASVSLGVGVSGSSPFTLSATTLSPATVSAGGTATSTVTISPNNAFNSAVSLTCTVKPTRTVTPTCALSSSSIAGGSGTSTLTVSTVAGTASLRTPQQRRDLVFYAMLFPVGGLTLLGAGLPSRRKRKILTLLGLMLCGLVFLMACGGGSSNGGGGGGGGTTAGTYTVTVTGTAGGQTQTQNLTLTVQ
jgi:hypothetical protein